MKALVVVEPEVIEIRDVPMPRPGPYQALVRIEACSFCSSTDLKIIANELPYVDTYPCILGHESVGEVVEVGARVKYLSAGERVLRPVAAYPGERIGDYASGWGGFAEYGVVTDWRAMVEDGQLSADAVNPWFKMHQKVPPGMSAADATMLITLKETLSSLQDTGDVAGRSVLVVGDGAVGLCFARWAKVLGGVPVVVAGHHDNRLERARQIGIDMAVNTSGRTIPEALAAHGAPARFDVIIDAVGSARVVEECYGLLSAGGCLSVYGVSSHMEARIDVLRLPVGARILRAPTDEPRVHAQVLSSCNLGVVQPQWFYTHVLPLDDAAEGVRLLKSREALKVVLVPEH
ncbi:MAG: zinc-binding dehydrogenase [Armatimonadetes bacterium]|nr:zinc-binding dehydrogenase [Armatimonadota bacterium]